MYKTIIKIDGMMCGMCEAHMNDLMRSKFRIKKVTSSASKGETIVISKDEIDIATAEKAVENIGYHLVSAESEIYEKKGLFDFLKK